MENLNKVLEFLNLDLEGDLFVILKVKKEWKLRYIKINKEVTVAFNNKYKKILQKLVDKGVILKEFMPTDYDPESKSYIPDKALDSTSKSLLSSIETAEEGGDIEHFDLGKIKIGTIKFIAIRFRDNNRKSLVIIRKYTNSKFLSNDKAIFLLLTTRSLKIAKSEKLFPIDYKADIINFDNELLILDRPIFNALFGDKFFEQDKEVLFDELKKEESFDKNNLEELEQKIKSINDKAKISNIKNSGTYRKFLEAFKNNPEPVFDELKKSGEDVTLDKSGTVTKIKFGNLKSLKRALNDDLVHSDITGESYISYQKERT